MKEKILAFIIGILVGAIIATMGFLVYTKNVKTNTENNVSNESSMVPMEGNGQMGGQGQGNMGEPPERPEGDSGEEPPAKPEEMTNDTTN